MVWAWAKAHHRSTCTYKYNDLKTGLSLNIYAVKKYESHSRLSPTIRLDEIASEFAEKMAKKMTFKRCK